MNELTSVQLHTAMLTLRLAGCDSAADVFQAELVRRASQGPRDGNDPITGIAYNN